MASKVDILKIYCIPKLNYLIHSLPLEVPHFYFKKFDRMSKKFIWNGKHPSKIQRPVNRGGVGLPKMLFYYYSISDTAHWSLHSERAPP